MYFLLRINEVYAFSFNTRFENTSYDASHELVHEADGIICGHMRMVEVLMCDACDLKI